MGKSINDYVGLDSYRKTADGGELTHQEIYTKLVNDIGLDSIIPLIPATNAEIEKALLTDYYLNNIPIKKWDDMHQAFIQRGLFRSLGITHSSLSETICTLKQAARMWVERDAIKPTPTKQ